MRLTDLTLRGLKCPAGKSSTTYFDDALTGFGVRVSMGGTQTYIVLYGPARRRVKIGRVGVLSLKQARDRAKIVLAQKTLNPHETPSVGFAYALEQFLASRRAKNRPRTAAETTRILEKYLLPAFRHEKLVKIAKHEILERIAKVRGSEGSHCLTAAKTGFRWFARQGYLTSNPLQDVEPQQPAKSRDRLLTDDEFLAIWRACDELDTFGAIVRLLFTTGQRRSQIAFLHSKWIKNGITFPSDIMKGGVIHRIPYHSLATTKSPQLRSLG